MPHRKHRSNKAHSNKAAENPKVHRYKSEAVSDKNRLFHNVKNANAGINQTVNVDVKIDQQDDCITSCFAGLAKCFGKGG